MTARTCTAPGCSSALYAKGMCRAHYHRTYYQANRAKWADAAKKRDRDAVSEYNARYREANSERIRKHKAMRYRENPDPVNERNRRNYHANRERAIRVMREWAKANPERVSQLARAGRARRRALERGGQVTRADYRDILAEHGMVCHLCGEPIESARTLHFDHVIPLARGGAHTPENIRPAHALCNLRKGARLP